MTQTDVLGAPYTAETIELADDFEGAVVATLVKLAAPTGTRKAVLHVHGFADYFFQTGYAAWWTDRGYDFYALDLRKYGRSIGPHQSPNYVADLGDYYAELDEAYARVSERDGHDHVVLSGHSTGGLTLSLWANDRRPALAGMVLNSPWFDLHGPAWMRTWGTTALQQLARVQPLREIPRNVSGLYARSLHRDHEGEWEFDLGWKPLSSWPARVGWLAAVRRGHARLHAGLDVPCPVLVLTSGGSASPAEMGEDVHSHDIVLDVDQIRQWAPSVGRHVTLVSIDGARHDVTLSREAPRTAAMDTLERWLAAWVAG